MNANWKATKEEGQNLGHDTENYWIGKNCTVIGVNLERRNRNAKLGIFTILIIMDFRNKLAYDEFDYGVQQILEIYGP